MTHFSLLVATLFGLIILIRTPRTAFTNRVLWALALCAGVIVAGQVLVWVQGGHRGFLWWFFNLDDDRNAPAALAAVMWVLMSLIIIAGSLRPSVPWMQKFYGWFVALVLFIVSLDDFYAIHETMIYDWQRPYMIAGGIFMLVNLAAFWFWFRGEAWANKRLVLLAAAGVFIIGVSGFIVESFAYGACEETPQSFICRYWWQAIALDEIFELFGTVIFIGAMLLYMQANSSPVQWQQVKRITVGGSLAWTALLLAFFWPLPAIESRLLAQPVSVDYADEDLRLVGYWTPSKVIQPGERVIVFLYWHTGAGVQRDYRLSTQLLSPDLATIAQDDELHAGQIPSTAWLPGMVVRKAVHFDVPPDSPTPASYRLMVRLWRGNPLADWQDVISLPIASSDQEVLTTDTALIGSVVALGPTPALAEITPADYTFADGFTLTGYDIPAEASAGGNLDLQFAWETERDLNRPLTQLVHLVGVGHDAFVALDSQPFGHRLPTQDWPGGAVLVDNMTVTLPADMAAGEYQLFTGMYDSGTLERQAITNGQGEPVADNAILLGTIAISD